MTEGDGQEIGHPVQRENFDLSKDARDVTNGEKIPVMSDDKAEHRSPAAMMRQMGFCPTKNMTPLQFLVAVMNDDIEKVFKNKTRRDRMEKRGGMGMSYRIEAAKTAARYLHMQMPAVTINKDESAGFGGELSAAIARGSERVRTRRIILETVERISPDVPLPPANYPPDLMEVMEGQIISDDELELLAEGDTDYDPDRD